MFTSKSDHHAIVIGASMIGLLTAEMLSRYFDRVTVIEKDNLQDTLEPRLGVPQACHSHAFLVKGKSVFEKFFPGYFSNLVNQGATLFDYSEDTHLVLNGVRLSSFPSGLVSIACTRLLMESTLRQRIRMNNKIQFLDNTKVTSLIYDQKHNAMTGVVFQSSDSPPHLNSVSATLIVDASGRNSQAPSWLKSFGFMLPKDSVVNAFGGYSSRIYNLPDQFAADWKVVGISANPRIVRAVARCYGSKETDYSLL